MIDFLQQIDTNLFLWFNGFHNSFFDLLMWLVSDKFVWLPMYAVFLYVMLKKYGTHHLLLFLIVMFFVNFAISDFLCGHFLRHLICRPRPTNAEKSYLAICSHRKRISWWSLWFSIMSRRQFLWISNAGISSISKETHGAIHVHVGSYSFI